MSEPGEMLERLIAACREAAQAILAVYGRDFDVQAKGDTSPLTEADMASHRILVRELGAITPDIPVLSEESSRIDWGQRRRWRRLWVVDPLDGTREFIKRNGEFTINLALVENHRPVLGILAVPVQNRCYTGITGDGAAVWMDYRDPQPIRTRRPAADPPVVLGSRSHGNPRTQAYFESLGTHERLVRGSALKFCAVAAGEADFYPRLGPTSEWDTAAGHAIVEAAGGRVTRGDGGPLTYNAGPSLINPDFFVTGDPDKAWPPPPPPGGEEQEL